MSRSRPTRTLLVATATLAASSLVLAACGGDDDNGDGAGKSGGTASSIIVGTTDKITKLDPAGSYDNGSFAVMNQVFPFLLNTPYGSPDPAPDIAAKAEFTAPKDYTVTLKPGLKFANGHALTASDVKFTFDRMVKINDPNGPASLLYNLDSTEAKDDTTVVFHLKSANDQIFPRILTSPAGPVIDEEVFSPDALTPDTAIVSGKAFAGPYTITSYDFNNLVSYQANPDYQGLLGAPRTPTVNVKYFADSSNLKLEVQQGGVDVAYRSLSPTDIESLRNDSKVKVVDGPGGEIRYIVFNFNTQPYGAKAAGADPAKALAVRQAVADLLDRAQLADQVYKNTYTPLYSYVPQGLTGATESLKSRYGDGSGGPSLDKAKQRLAGAGVSTPVELKLQYNPDHYGPSSGDEYALVKDQLQKGGLFKVDLQSTEWVQYSKDRVADLYPAYQLGWFPDYSDADNYLTPFFLKENFLSNHFSDQVINDLILKQAVTANPDERTKLIEEIQEKVADQLSTVPLLQGAQVAVTGSTVSGADTTLDPSFKFRYGALSKTD